VARNRKRAKERRARRPQPVTTRARDRNTGAPSPLEHAAPDAEIAEQAELPPGLTEQELDELEGERVQKDDAQPHAFGGGRIPGVTSEPITEVEADAGEVEADASEVEAHAAGIDPDVAEFQAEEDDRPAPAAGAGAVAVSSTAAAQPRAVPGNRLINFLQGSWRELQRVQWPDRPQVIQATGVVIGFVIVAGVFLGVADWASGHLVSLIVNGHW
jgi:preprotein translocase SecE subunit